MKKSVVFMFSGQGSQYFQMGKGIYGCNDTFRKWMNILDDISIEFTGVSIIDIIYCPEKNKNDKFDKILLTHPAIFMIQFAMAQTLIEAGIKPNYLLGSSLGEFVSIAVSGALNYRDALQLVILQAQAFKTNCSEGSMLAVLHDVDLYERDQIIHGNSKMVSVNYHSHFVIAGTSDSIHEIETYLNNSGIVSFKLPVLYAFHSQSIEPAYSDFMSQVNSKTFSKPTIPIASCLYGKLIMDVPQQYLWDIARHPILFQEAFCSLEQDNDCIYIDIGPSGTLHNFAKHHLRKNSRSEIHSILSMFGKETDADPFIEIISKLKGMNKKKNFEGRSNMLTVLFPGQGSQYKGMGGELFDEFTDWVHKADAVLGYSIKELCLNDTKSQLTNTRYSQSAIYVVNALSYIKRLTETNCPPDFVAGHSLGEYNALLAAGVFDFETGLLLVKKRGELMSYATGGAMAAVLGLSEEKVKSVIQEYHLHGIEIANFNSPFQIVISGRKEDINKSKPIFESIHSDVVVSILNVSGAFHSKFMNEAKREFEEILHNTPFSSLKIPVISNVTARPYQQTELIQTLSDQINHPVNWTESIRYLMGKGEMTFNEVGPGRVLTGLLKRIQSEAEPLVIVEEQNEWVRNVTTSLNEPSILNDIDKRSIERQLKEEVTAFSLGSSDFKKDYNLKYAYLTGGMYKGISSKELVVRMGKCGMMGFFGTGGLDNDQIRNNIYFIQRELSMGQPYGINIVHNPGKPEKEEEIIDFLLSSGVRNLEAAAFLTVTPALISYHAKGLHKDRTGNIVSSNKLLVKVSRPEVAEAFLSPAPERILMKLLHENKITLEEVELSREVPVADDLCIEADSAGHTDGGVAYALMPAMMKLRDIMTKKYSYLKQVRIGAAGGIGTPEAVMAAFMLGADFILTGSINQATVEAGTSDGVKDLLQQVNVQDTEYAPAGDMFELGAKVQVLKRGLFFPARANKLFELYRQYDSLDDIDEKTRIHIQDKYFKRSFDKVFEEVKTYQSAAEIDKAERNSKHKMALVFRWYFAYTTRLALTGSEEFKVDYQVHCGPAMGAFNQWVKGTELENWRNRHVDEIAVKLMIDAAKQLNQRYYALLAK